MFNRKIALITGASRGIGRKTAEIMALEGYHVVINYNTSELEAKNIESHILSQGGSAEIYQADVGNYNESKKMIEFCIDKHKKLDVLINNAGISQIKLFSDITPEEWNEMMRVNLTGVFNCTQNAVKYMISEKSGKIINVSSIWGMTGASCEVHYSATKAGIIGFTKALAKELGPSNIQVNCVAPGIIATDMMNDFSQDELNELIESTPLQKLGQTEDVANAIVFLASAKANFITGQVISPNGGYVV